MQHPYFAILTVFISNYLKNSKTFFFSLFSKKNLYHSWPTKASQRLMISGLTTFFNKSFGKLNQKLTTSLSTIALFFIVATSGSFLLATALVVEAAMLPVRPVFEGLTSQADGSYRARFGYYNENNILTNIPVGDNNRFHPEPWDRGQTIAFLPGRQNNQFSVVMDCASTIVWTLAAPGLSVRTATATTPACNNDSNSSSSSSSSSDTNSSSSSSNSDSSSNSTSLDSSDDSSSSSSSNLDLKVNLEFISENYDNNGNPVIYDYEAEYKLDFDNGFGDPSQSQPTEYRLVECRQEECDFSNFKTNPVDGSLISNPDIGNLGAEFDSGWLNLEDISYIYDFSQNNGLAAVGEQTLCVQARDSQGNLSNVSCDTIVLNYNPENIYDPKGPFKDQPYSCENPYGWFEIRNSRTETTKTYQEPKLIETREVKNPNYVNPVTGPVTGGGALPTEKPFITEYIRIDYDYWGNKKEIKLNPEEYFRFKENPNPTNFPAYYQRTICSYLRKVHYRDSSTNWWEEVDNYLVRLDPGTPERQQGYVYTNAANDFRVYFGDNTEEGFWYFSNELDYKVDRITLGSGDTVKELNFARAKVKNNTITYPEVLEGVDLQYSVTSRGVSKYIIIKNQEALEKNDLSKIDFEMRSSKKLIQEGNLDPNSPNFNPVIKIEGSNQLVMVKPFTMETNSYETNFESFKINSDSTKLTIYPDQEYLNSSERTFPIMIDPTFDKHSDVTKDAFIQKSNPNTASSAPGNKPWFLSVGGNFIDTSMGNANFSDTRSFLSFDLPSEVKSHEVKEATLAVHQYNTYGHRFTADIRSSGDFDESNTSWSGGWGTSRQPDMGTDHGDITFEYKNLNGRGNTHRIVSSNISGLINEQKNSGRVIMGIKDQDENANRGVAFCAEETHSSYGHPCSPGDKNPVLKITVQENRDYPPSPPKTENPNNVEFIGNCDMSASPFPSGNCNVNTPIEYEISNIQDGDGGSADHKIIILDNHKDNNSWWDIGGWIGRHKGSYKRQLETPNGDYQWSARNRDPAGQISDRATNKSFIVDTQPPVQTSSLEINPNSHNPQIEFSIPNYIDNHTSSTNILSYSSNFFKTKFGISTITFDFPNTEQTHLWQVSGQGINNQQWDILPTGQIQGPRGKCLDAPGKGNEGKVHLWSCHHTSSASYLNQAWEIENYSDYVLFRLKNTNKCLAKRDDPDYSGNIIVTTNCNSSSFKQRFVLSHHTFSNTHKNPTHQLSYFVQVSTSSTFASNSIFYQGWQSSKQFQLACVLKAPYQNLKPGDPIPEELMDATKQLPRTCLTEGQYHIRVKAKDRQHSLSWGAINRGNISKWSEIKTVDIDLSPPIVKNLQISENRISPTNPTSVGIKDKAEVTFEFSEEKFKYAQLAIQGTGSNSNFGTRYLTYCYQQRNIYTPTKHPYSLISSNEQLLCSNQNIKNQYQTQPQGNLINFNTVKFVIDGKVNGITLPDGTYLFILKFMTLIINLINIILL